MILPWKCTVGHLGVACIVACYGISAGSVAFIVTDVPAEAQHCLSTAALDPACGHPLEMIYQGAQHYSFSYVFRKQLLEIFLTQM